MKKDGSRKIVTLLDKEIRSRKRGTIAAINRLVGRGNAWWYQRVRAGNLSVAQMMIILEFLGLNPVRFIRTALGSEDQLELDRPTGEPPEIVRQAWKRFRSEGHFAETVGEDSLKTLDTMRYDEPEKAADQALSLVEYCPRSLLPRLLGVAGSAWRLLMQLDQAQHVIYAAIQMSRELGDPNLLGESLQRMAYVFFERAELTTALELSQRATHVFFRSANKAGVGKTLVDQGIWLGYMEERQQATAVHKMALEWLPAEEHHNRLTAYQNIVLNSRELGDLDRALEFLPKLEAEIETLPAIEKGRFKWLQGNIWADLDNFEQAVILLEEAVDGFEKTHLGTMAMALCDLIQVELRRGNSKGAFRAASRTRLLIEPLRDNKIATSAIADLLRDGEAGLTLALARDVHARLESELMRRPVWRQLWVR